jgi:hypothetical protein
MYDIVPPREIDVSSSYSFFQHLDRGFEFHWRHRCLCVLRAFILSTPCGGKNTSTVIPASLKRRQKGNPVVSGETASRPKRRLMRTYHWISLFKSYIESQQISL